ncbi:hypothetical protein OA346_03160 [Candidatus Pelagibacter sp.]|nr:hypothetical protein [Candidatus Pelagibacter sp.]
MNWLIRQIAKVTLIGKLVEKLGPKVPIIFIFTALIFTAFYLPYEYENFLEFKQKYPEDKIGLILNLLRPVIINVILIILVASAFSAEKERKKRIELEESEQQRKEAEALAMKQEAMRKLDELKKSPVGKATGIVTTKEGIGAIGGGAIGAALGGSLGVAGKIVGIGVALNGGIVLAGVGALVGFLGVKAFKKNKDEKTEQEKIKQYGEKINQETRDKNK